MGYPVKFGKYLLLERVNVGGMAEVFKAKTFGVAGFERILAIKRILPTLVEDDEFVRMFIDEARIAVQLNHANIAQIYELGKHGEHFYIAMEYLSSKDLRAILDKMRLNNQLMPIPQAAYIISKVCEGLDYAHRRLDPANNPMNIIHRDVSPQNVLISYEGEVKIIDFGIAKAANRASKTQAGVLKGKFGYMSPEQVRGLPIDRRSDVFAVGVLLYEMLTGERLFIGESDFSTLERVRNAEVAPPTTFNKKITPELEEIVLKALAREVEDRFQWASELAEALQVFLFEERSLYNAKRLAAYMKETYNTDIASERDKMEQYLKLDQDPSKPAAARPPVTPNEATALGPRTSEAQDGTDDYDYEDDYDAEDYEGEERTIVIEASAAGADLQPGPPDGGPKTPPTAAGDPLGQAPKVTGDVTNDDYLVEASLYGEEDYEDDDDAKTQVSFDNPFDENVKDNDPPMPPPPSAEDAGPLLIHEDSLDGGEMPGGPPDDEVVPGLGTAGGGAGFDPVAAAMQDELSGQLPPAPAPRAHTPKPTPTPPNPVPSTTPPQAATANPGALDPAGPDRLLDDGQDMTPTPDVDGGEAAVIKPEKKKGIGAGLIALMLVGMLFAFGLMGTTVWFAYSRFVAGPAPAVANQTMKLLPAGDDVPAAVVVKYNGEQVATTLPAEIQLSDGPHKIEVTADGRQPFAIDLPSSLPQLFVTLPKATGAAVVEKGDADKKPAEKPDVESETEEAVATKDDAPEDAPEAKDPPPDAKAAAVDEKASDEGEKVAKESGEGDEKADEGTEAEGSDAPKEGEGEKVALSTAKEDGPVRPANLAPDAWRISFAAIGAEKREPVQGAEVFFNGAIIGRTPFEGEFPTTTDAVELEVRAPGFLAKKISVARGDRVVVGPATVSLKAASEDEGEEKAAAEGDKTAEAAAGEEGAAGAKLAAADAPDEGEKAEDTASEGAASDGEGEEAEEGEDAAEEAKAAEEEPEAAEPESAPPAKKEASAAKAKPAKSKTRSTKSKASKSKAATKKPKKADEPKKAAVAYSTLNVASQPFAEVYVNRKKQKHGTPLVAKRALRLKQGTNYMLFVTQDGKKYPYKIELGPDSSNNKLILKLGRSISTSGNVKATYLK